MTEITGEELVTTLIPLQKEIEAIELIRPSRPLYDL